MNTVVGNVSRTHHPCGACGALVETCNHWQRGYTAPSSNPGRKREQERAAARAAVAASQAELLRAFATAAPPSAGRGRPKTTETPGALP